MLCYSLGSRSIIRRGPGKWLVRNYLGFGANGKRRYLDRTVHGNKAGAQRLLNDRMRRRDLGARSRRSACSSATTLIAGPGEEPG